MLVDSVMDYAIFMLDPDGYVVSWNLGAQRIKGYEAEEIVGRHFSTFYTPEDIDRDHPAEELEIAKKEGRFEEEGWRVRKDGSRFWANVVITALFDRDGTLHGFAKVTRDMTHRREMEQQLRDLNRQLESFAYSVSHDLRAPLRNMIFLSKILLLDHREKLDEQGQKLLDTLGSSASKLAQVIMDLLTLSRLSRADLKLVPIDVTSMVRELWREVYKAPESGPSFEIQVDEGMTAKADKTLMRVILLNLLDNAIKFSPTGGTVRVGTKRVRGTRAFFVEDEGIGIDMAYAHKVFQPFERLVTDEVATGSGVGLANVQQAVMKHGGKVWVESELGKGATFYFTVN